MDDVGQPQRRQESSTRSSTHRLRPRGRKSSQSLHSNGRPAETTFTSFEPFSPPRREPSTDSGSSSKRSRSIYAPNRQNSVDDQPPLPTSALSRQTTNVSLASRSLMNAIVDMEQIKNPLFTEDHLQHYRQNPSALQTATPSILQGLTETHTAQQVIKTFAADLAVRDAEVTRLRRKIEELASLFKDHMCEVHSHSRLEADKILQDLTLPKTAEPDLSHLLQDASCSTLKESTSTSINDLDSIASEEIPPRPPVPRSLVRQSSTRSNQNITVRGMLSVFGGRATIRPDKAKRQSIAGVLNTAKTAPPPRRASVSQVSAAPSMRSPAPGPVEMNSIVEPEKLPPPLVTSKDIKYQYPAYTADIYGFIIDSNRTTEWINENRPQSPMQRQRADTPVTSASSIASSKADVDGEEDEDEEEETEEGAGVEQTSWTKYLKVGGSALGSLSWLPVAPSPFANIGDGGQVSESPSEIGHEEAAEKLQRQLSEDYETLQKSRLIPWERFLASDQQETARNDFFSNFLRRGQQHSASQTGDLASVGVLSKELRTERTRLILGGVPMNLRAKIWSQYIHEALIHDPDEYSSLVKEIPSVAAETRSEISDDIPRTLANNVFFRSGAGRAQLTELLSCFTVKKPEIGYCQGMNLIGGYLLLALPTTETAFWVFCYMIEHVLAETYFDATMRGASIEIAVLRSYVRDLIPRLAKHLDELDIADQETVPYNWFLTAFASTLTIEALYRVWDVVLGLPTQKNFLLRVAIALLKVNEEALLAVVDPFEMRGFMDRNMARDVAIDGLVKASSQLGQVVRDDEVRKRRRHFAFKVDEVR